MPEQEPNVRQGTKVALISIVLILLSLVFLFLSLCGGFVIAFSPVAGSIGGEARAVETGLALLVFSLAALYLIYRAWRRVRGMGRRQQ